MPFVKYSYSVSQDFPNQKVDLDRLTQEIEGSVIKVVLDYINMDGDECDIWFREDLDGTDESILTTIVHNHSGEPLPKSAESVKIVASSSVLQIQEKGFPDFTGYPFFSDSVHGNAVAGQVSYFYLSFDETIRLQGGGFRVGETASEEDFVSVELTYGEGGPVVGSFLDRMYVWPGRVWEKFLPDSKEIPVGVCLRLTYNSFGADDVAVTGWYDMRRAPNA